MFKLASVNCINISERLNNKLLLNIKTRLTINFFHDAFFLSTAPVPYIFFACETKCFLILELEKIFFETKCFSTLLKFFHETKWIFAHQTKYNQHLLFFNSEHKSDKTDWIVLYSLTFLQFMHFFHALLALFYVLFTIHEQQWLFFLSPSYRKMILLFTIHEHIEEILYIITTLICVVFPTKPITIALTHSS